MYMDVVFVVFTVFFQLFTHFLKIIFSFGGRGIKITHAIILIDLSTNQKHTDVLNTKNCH